MAEPCSVSIRLKLCIQSQISVYRSGKDAWLVHIGDLKVNGYTFRGSNSIIFFLPPFSIWGQPLKERICS